MQALGIIDIVWQGQPLPVEKGAKYKPGGIKRTAVNYGRRTSHAAEYEGVEITVTTNLERGQRYKDLYKEAEGELQVICDTGQTFAHDDAFITDIPSFTGGEGGKIEITWMASEGEEVFA